IPRRVHARVLEAITQVGVRAVSYDVFFTGPARDGPEADQAFALALAKSGRAVLSMPCTSDYGADAARVAAVVGSSLAGGAAPAPLCEGVVAPNASLMASAAAVSQVELARSASGNVRGAYPLTEVGGRKLFSLSLATYLTGEGIAPGAIVQERSALGLGPVRVPVDDTGAVLASFRIPTEGDVLSYGELVKALGTDPPTLPERYAERLRGRYVLVGQTAQSVRDVGPFANGEQLPLVLLHGALLADLLEGEPLRELSLPVQLLLVAVFGALLTAAALWLRPVLLGLGLLVALWGLVGGGLLLAQAGIAVGPLGPALAAVLACALVASGRIATEERNRRRVKGAFHAYLNERVLARVLADPRRELPLEGARRRVTVLCASAREPASGAERVAPEEGIARRRARLKDLVARILEQDGRVEVLRGDGVVAVFGDPIANPDHARRAVAAALGILRTVGADERGLELRIGVATGLVLAGNVSPEEGRIEYAVVGSPVDEAEALARRAPVGGLLVSLETRDDCADAFTFEPSLPEDPILPAYLARARA
ncbi:MAG TPA: adenylate/guanylate cyclase domain-containing protein, partial [Longimicrobium sp.]|nr:adenylate/guanylate cyclase domain-containing protein [Longimicrobium sp.]